MKLFFVYLFFAVTTFGQLNSPQESIERERELQLRRLEQQTAPVQSDKDRLEILRREAERKGLHVTHHVKEIHMLLVKVTSIDDKSLSYMDLEPEVLTEDSTGINTLNLGRFELDKNFKVMDKDGKEQKATKIKSGTTGIVWYCSNKKCMRALVFKLD